MDRITGLVPAGSHGLRHALPEVILQQAEGNRLESPGHRGDLSEHINAVDVLFYHPLQAANLALDPAQPFEVGVLVLGVTVHGARIRGHTGRTQPPAASPSRRWRAD